MSERHTQRLEAADPEAIEQAQLMVDSITDYEVIRLDRDGMIRSWNRGGENLKGYTAEEIIGQHVSVFYTDEDRGNNLIEQELKTAEAKGRFEFEGWHVRKDGSRFRASIVLTPLRGAGDELAGFVKVTRDITAQSQYARSLIEASVDPLVTISPEGKITDVNEATVNVTGVGREQLVGTDFSDYFTEPEQARAGYQRVFAEGSVTDYPLTIRHRGGRLTDVLYNASVYRDARGEVLGVFAAARDVTAQKQAEELIRRQQKQLLEAQAAVIRELSTPVLQLRPGLLMLPIIGAIDSTRARQLTEALLESVRANRARVVVLDVTGVPAVDSRVANHLVQTVEACRLMGATAVVTGLSAEVAQSMVVLGVDLMKLNTAGDLQGGIEEADRLLGYRVSRQDGGDGAVTEG